MNSLYILIDTVLAIYTWVIIVQAILSWLIAFDVVNRRNQIVYTVGGMLYRLTEPAYRPVRRFMPNLGGIDLSPLVVLLLIYFIRLLLAEYWPFRV